MKLLLSEAQYSRAKTPLKLALDKLNLAAKGMHGLDVVAEPGAVIQNNLVKVANPRFDPLKKPGTKDEIEAYESQYVSTYVSARKSEWKAHMRNYIRDNYARATPTDDAVKSIGGWLKKAVECRYPVHDAKIRELLCDVILMIRTEGFTGEDTTGTQMGNFQGQWRGGGF
ncbi:hypothetical protein [Roseibium sp.]|uniref:hypothetical protein n=1 Tax=Roseibium sp. TaxID=1936156 RepID=UPI003D136B3C